MTKNDESCDAVDHKTYNQVGYCCDQSFIHTHYEIEV